jgi:hypothetical protein
MSGPDVPPSGTPSRGVPAPQQSLEEILTGARVPETEDEMSLLALTEALSAPARPDELASLEADVAAFGAARREALAARAVVVPLAARRRRPAALAAAAVAGVTASVLLVGTAAAALTGSLPDPLQRVAHDLVGAPLPDTASETATAARTQGRSTTAAQPVGPDAATSAAAVVGLCRAFGDRDASVPASGSTAYAALKAAADAKGLTVAQYCAGVLATAKPTAPGQTKKPATPPGQTTKPSTPPGQTKKPSTPPGQTAKPTVPPGSTKKPTTPPGSTKKPSTPPGQTKSPGRP